MEKRNVLVLALTAGLLLSACGVRKGYVAGAQCNADLTGCSTLASAVPTPTPALGPRVTTVPKVMAATAAARDITFNLGTELAGASLPGVTFTVAVSAITPAGASTASYIFDNPRISTNGVGATPVRVRDIRIIINGTLISSAIAYATVDRSIAVGQVNRNLTDGAMTVTPALAPATDMLAISFSSVTAAPGYNPPTLTQLRAATGVFGARCVSCHNATVVSGNLNLLANAGGTSMFSAVRVLGFDPDNSKVINRMSRGNADAGVMPTGGWASVAEQAAAVDAVRQWILDGAPIN
jgi:hypothetical protein